MESNVVKIWEVIEELCDFGLGNETGGTKMYPNLTKVPNRTKRL